LIMISTTGREIAVRCLTDGPLAASARSLVEAAHTLGSAPAADIVRTWCVPYLFGAAERIFDSDEEPIDALNRVLCNLARALCEIGSVGLAEMGKQAEILGGGLLADESGVRHTTSEHYGELFQAFSNGSYWEEPARLVRDRLDRNGIVLEKLSGKALLDAGCGGGRYTVAWRLLGVGQAIGLDASVTGITDARRRVRNSGLEGVSFEVGDVLALPFADNSVDIVFSNGVLHHTTAWARGVSEIVRVLRPGGFGWLYLIEDPGGLFWDVIEILRVILQETPPSIARDALRLLGISANRSFYMLDHVLVPINLRLTPSEIESCLSRFGAVRTRRLCRGTDFDRIEHIARGEALAHTKYGVGENRYVFSKG
jgi:SAM-dependent methyltransferase